jgi:hypothetical protein
MRLTRILYAPEGEGGSAAPAAPAPAAPAPAAPAAPITSAEMTPSDAGRILRSLRKTQAAEAAAAPPTDGVEDLAVYGDEIPSQEDGPAPDQDQASAETDEQAPDGDEPQASEPPKSWSKEAREIWSSLDPQVQAYIAQRDSEDSTAVRKAQSEANQLRQYAQQAVEAEKAQLEQVRQQYEAALPDLYNMLSQSEEFSDIQSFEDVERMAKEDWARYIEYDAHVKKVGIVQAQMLQAQQRQQQEYANNWQRWSTQEDMKFAERVPDMKDPVKAKVVHETGAKTLTDVGFSPHEINELWHGRASLSMRDARVQELFHDAIKFRASKGKVEAARAQPLPTVQRPGVAQFGNRNAQALQSAKQKLSQSGSIEDGLTLLRAQRAANARRSR